MRFQSPPFWCLMTTQEFAVLQMDIMIKTRHSLQKINGLSLEVRTTRGEAPPMFYRPCNKCKILRYSV